MKLNELLKVIHKYQNIKVYNGESIIYSGNSKKLIDENILEREIKGIFTLQEEVDEFYEAYIIISLY